MATAVEQRPAGHPREAPPNRSVWETACGYARNFLDNRFVYVLVSPRARGLSVGINLNPDKRCNFDCVYCEVNRSLPSRDHQLDVSVMVRELEQTLTLALENRLAALPGFHNLPAELLQVRHVALSGDGEPTLCPDFSDAVRAVVHLRALGKFPFFKLVLITNATGLHTSQVKTGLHLFTPTDEVWLKLEAGTRAYYERINRPTVPLEEVLENILNLARQRPVVIQSLFPRFHNEEPRDSEIVEFVTRLRELKDAGARISLVQIYSAMRAIIHPECGHLSLRSLSRIAQAVRTGTDLPVEVF
jgi:wyosine [tRNA(Phe)-imidazoG37] synthetase (radical SAM superfamily)